MFNNTHHYKKSVYGKDFTGKTGERRSCATFRKEYPNSIEGPFYEYLTPENFKNRLPPEITYEQHDEAIKGVVKKYPCLKEYFQEPIIFDGIDKTYKQDFCTIYQVEICGIDELLKLKRSHLRLPNDSYFPITTQKCSYRHPNVGSNNLELSLTKPIHPPDNIKFCEVTHRVMETSTGESEYMRGIGQVGTYIMAQSKYVRERRQNKTYIMAQGQKGKRANTPTNLQRALTSEFTTPLDYDHKICGENTKKKIYTSFD